MDRSHWLADFLQPVVQAWAALGPTAPYYAWLAGGLIGLVAWVWISHRLLRLLAGHRKLRGAWHSEARYAELMQLLHEDQERGRRVLSHEEIAALRRYRYGNTVRDVVGHKGTGLFS